MKRSAGIALSAVLLLLVLPGCPGTPESEGGTATPSSAKGLPRMWEYGSKTCHPCQQMKKILTPMIAEYAGRVDIRIIDIYQERKLSDEAGIRIIPTQVFYDKEGKELFRHVGLYPRDSILARFREYGWE